MTPAEALPIFIGPDGGAGEVDGGHGEAGWLATLAGAGLRVGPMVLIPAAAESAFYRLNNLPAQLARLFAPVSSFDPDEDEIEELAPMARALLADHFLLAEFIDAFYEATARLEAPFVVRRQGSSGIEAPAGRAALMAVRKVWLGAWSEEAILGRLRATGSVALEAEAVLVSAAAAGPVPTELGRTIADLLRRPVRACGDRHGRITCLKAVVADTSAAVSRGKV